MSYYQVLISQCGVEILRFSTLMGCLMGNGCEKNKSIKSVIRFVMDMCKSRVRVIKNKIPCGIICVYILMFFLTNKGWRRIGRAAAESSGLNTKNRPSSGLWLKDYHALVGLVMNLF